jgi:HD-GYP domain-containing protein (c-di-GMP phosphodiesterase class II)
VVDAYDAMTEDRAYRKALSPRAAVAELQQHAGTQFDPVIVEAFVEKVLGGESK